MYMWAEVGSVMDQEERNSRNGRRNDVLGERDRECGCSRRNGEEAVLGLRDEENGRKRREEVAGVEDGKQKCHHEDHDRENLLEDILNAVENIEECTCDEIEDLLEDILDAIENLSPDKHEEEALEHALCIILKKLAEIDENTEAINQKLNAVLNLLEKLLCRLDKIIDIL